MLGLSVLISIIRNIKVFSDFLGVKTKKSYHVDTGPQTSLSIVENMFELSTSFSIAGLYM